MKVRRVLLIAVSVVVAFLILLGMVAGFFSNIWWFESLGLGSVFWKTFESEYLLWAAGFIVFGLLQWVNIRICLTSKVPVVMRAEGMVDPKLERFLEVVGRYLRGLAYAVSVLFAFIMAGTLSDHWMELLVYFQGESFGMLDPVFSNDVGFYVFSLPFILAIKNWLLAAVILMLLSAAALYFVRQGAAFVTGRFSISDFARRHLAVLVAALTLIIAIGYWLGRYDVLYSVRSSGFFGAGFTDVYAQIPAAWIVSVAALLAGGIVIKGLLAKKMKTAVRGVIGFIVVAILAQGVYPSLVQKFVVNPNEQIKELPFIENNILFTRNAFDLNRIEEKNIHPKNNLMSTDLRADSATIRNIMLWDYRPLASTLDQLQVIRLYYHFADVDIDRYRLPDGSYRQVMLSARELDHEKLPQNARTWVNLKLVYTHGYGLGMSPVNVVTDEGLPEFFVKDIPPVSDIGLEIQRPEIYFGEETNSNAFVNGNIDEFDYPLGDVNKMTRYQEIAGVPVGGFFKRLLFAMHFADLNLLISGYVSPDSRILYTRNISERMHAIAPYLKYDEDPYLVIANGRLYWICDAYTTTSVFPYSRPVAGFNYIRNSVKVVIDAYNGSTNFYTIQPERDPIIRAYQRIFPDLFHPQSGIPAYLREHLRYPQDLFDIQSEIYGTYHMEDPQVFYNKEDLWNVANEKLQDEVVQMESYFAIMRLPGEKEEEFIQMIPYTPNRRDNMIAWLCARSDGANYGKMLVYKFPKQDLTYGPMQVSARIDQAPEISQQLTLWNQQGSRVTKGNLLVIPIKEDVLYVQPIYLQATSGKLPELKRIIVSYGNQIAMEATLDLAIMRVFGSAAAAPVPVAGKPAIQPKPEKDAGTVAQLAREAMSHYNQARQYLKDGNWTKYGEELDMMKKNLERLVQATSK